MLARQPQCRPIQKPAIIGGLFASSTCQQDVSWICHIEWYNLCGGKCCRCGFEQRKKGEMKRFLLLDIILLFAISGCTTLPPTPAPTCAQQSVLFLKDANALFVEWDDANALANNTSRIALGPQIANLQAISRRFKAIPAPDCANQAKVDFSKYMDKTLEGYLAFMGGMGSMDVNVIMQTAKIAQERGIKELTELSHK
jgi:hypothetical protein